MPWRNVPGQATRYALVAFDKDGVERSDDRDSAGGPFSEKVLASLVAQPVSDVFLFSHGWKGDVPAALDQYDRWIRSLVARADDRAQAEAKRPGFAPLHIGLHWPSLPFGDEEIGAGISFGLGAAPVANLVDLYAERLGDPPRARAALAIIFEEARRNAAGDVLTEAARQAYLDLARVLAVGAEGQSGDPDTDRAAFDPDAAVENAAAAADFGSFDLGGVILAPLRQLSFWSMKRRARTVGENGMRALVARLQDVAPATRIHLMGHSFGCIVMSSVLAGPAGARPLSRPVDSCILVQGAMSLWSYASDIPMMPGKPGYFHRLLGNGSLGGPLLVTTSKFDRAVGTLYPIAAGVATQVDYAPGSWPEYGAIGAFGIRGVDRAQDAKMLPADEDYRLTRSTVLNLEASQFIRKGDGISGAHSDIDGPEVAHAIWQAALS